MKKIPFRWFIYIALIAGLSFILINRETKETLDSKSFSYLETQIVKDQVQRIAWDPNGFIATIRAKNNSLYTVSIPAVNTNNEGFARILKLARENKVDVKASPYSGGSESPISTLLRSLPMILFAGLLIFILRSQGLFSSKAIKPVTSKATFDDVAGCDEAIVELQDVRAFLEDPKRYKDIGAKVPKGVLLYGPPGTGKTLLARAVANEAGIPFYSASGSEFIEMFAGLGARRVRTLFEQAKKTAPSIIFIDELDAVGGKRSGGGGDGAQKEADQTLVQILKEMDGFDVQDNPVIVMGATNRLETLDPALTRPGRFDRHIAVDPPDRNGRLAILEVHAADKKLAPDVDLELIATQTAGMTGASLAHLLNEAALLGARDNQKTITFANIDDAYFRIVAGAKKQHRALNQEERITVAYHEIGHALVGEKFKGSNKVHKISIIPRGQSGGQTLYVSDEDVFLHKEQDLRDQIAALLGGRASEEIHFGRLTSGARDDLKRATNIAMAMVTELGMSKTLGLIVETEEHKLSDEIDNQAKQEVKTILEEEYQRAYKAIQDNKEFVKTAAEALLVEETIDRVRFLELIGMPDSPIEDQHLVKENKQQKLA